MKIVYLISHGHTARGAFQTNLLSKLADKGIEVTVVAKADPEGELQRQLKEQGASLALYTPPQSSFLHHLEMFRRYVHQNIRKNPALWEKHQRLLVEDQYSAKRKMMVRIYHAASYLFRVAPFLKGLFRSFEYRKFKDQNAINLLKELQPDAIVSTRPVDIMETYFLNAARRLKIERIMYVLSWDNITAKGIFPELADNYLTWGPVMNEELKEYYKVPDASLHLTGVTHFDVHHQIMQQPQYSHWLEKLGLSGSKPYFFFTMSASYYAPNEIDIIEWLVSKIEANTYGEDMQMIIRPHMHNFQEGFSDLSWTERLMSLKSSRVAIDLPDLDNSLLTWYMKDEDMLRLSNLLAGASICFNSGSTIAIESCMMDKPTIITLFDIEDWPEWRSVKRIGKYIHLKKLFDTGAVKVVGSFEEMDRWISSYVNDPGLDREKRKQAFEAECYKNDGKSTQRFVEHVKKILTRTINK